MLLGLMYAQSERPERKTGWRWPVGAALVLVPVVSLYQSDVWAQRGRAAQADGQYDVAAEDFEAAQTSLVFNPDYVNAQGINVYVQGLSRPQEAAALEAEALAKARLAQRLDPHDGQHYQLEGRVLLAQGDLKGAERALRAALRLDDQNHPDYATDLAGILVQQDRPAEAVAVAQDMLAKYPAAVRALRVADETLPGRLADLEALVGNVALRAGRLDGAEAAAKRGLALEPRNLRARALLRQVEQRRAASLAVPPAE
jgi:tetratricopeptide (TPR) repeat protein